MNHLLTQIECKSKEIKVAALKELKNVCQQCRACELYKTRTCVVFSDGSPDAKIMLIGEAPGADEDATGKPFVGRAGQLLNQFLVESGIDRQKDLYICNTLKCRPPENRDPLPEEKEACKEYLDAQIEILKPKIILLCGRVAVNSMLGTTQGITKIRGKWYEGPNFSKMMPIYHPSYLLRNDSREKGSPKWQMWQDIQEIKRVYDQMD